MEPEDLFELYRIAAAKSRMFSTFSETRKFSRIFLLRHLSAIKQGTQVHGLVFSLAFLDETIQYHKSSLMGQKFQL